MAEMGLALRIAGCLLRNSVYAMKYFKILL